MPAAKIARRVGPEEEPCKEIASIWLHRGPLAKYCPELVAQSPRCRENTSTWLMRHQVEAYFLQRGCCVTNSAPFLRAEAPSAPSRLNSFAREAKLAESRRFLGEAVAVSPSRRLLFARKPWARRVGDDSSHGSPGRAESAKLLCGRHSATKKRGIAHQISRAASSRALNSAQGACSTKPAAILCNCKSSRPAQRRCRTMRPVQLYRLPAELAYAVSSATAALSSSTRSRFSQVNSGSSRPKWP